MKRLLLTSFEPFGGHTLNASSEVGRVLSAHPVPGVELEWLQLSVVAPDCVAEAWQGVQRWQPDLVLALGQSSHASVLHVEDRANNLDHFSLPDNAGNQPTMRLILPGAPPFYRTTVPLDQLFSFLVEKDIAHKHSRHAGTYVCNHLYFGLLHRARMEALHHQTLFLHLPLLPCQRSEQHKGSSQPLETLVEAVRQVIRGCLG